MFDGCAQPHEPVSGDGYPILSLHYLPSTSALSLLAIARRISSVFASSFSFSVGSGGGGARLIAPRATRADFGRPGVFFS